MRMGWFNRRDKVRATVEQCSQVHSVHNQQCACDECEKQTGAAILELTWVSLRRNRPYYTKPKDFVNGVKKCIDSRLMERKWFFIARRPYKMYSKVRVDEADGTVSYYLQIRFKENPHWTRLWEMVMHDIQGRCVLPIEPTDLRWSYTAQARDGETRT